MTLVYCPTCYFLCWTANEQRWQHRGRLRTERHDVALFVHQLIEADMGKGMLGLERNCVCVTVGALQYFLRWLLHSHIHATKKPAAGNNKYDISYICLRYSLPWRMRGLGLHGVLFDPQVESSGRNDRPPPLPPHHPRQHIGPFTEQLVSNQVGLNVFPWLEKLIRIPNSFVESVLILPILKKLFWTVHVSENLALFAKKIIHFFKVDTD